VARTSCSLLFSGVFFKIVAPIVLVPNAKNQLNKKPKKAFRSSEKLRRLFVSAEFCCWAFIVQIAILAVNHQLRNFLLCIL
jgi:hypothetical protein